MTVDNCSVLHPSPRRKTQYWRTFQHYGAWTNTRRPEPLVRKLLKIMVGERGFEPPIPWSRTSFCLLLIFVEIA